MADIVVNTGAANPPPSCGPLIGMVPEDEKAPETPKGERGIEGMAMYSWVRCSRRGVGGLAKPAGPPDCMLFLRRKKKEDERRRNDERNTILSVLSSWSERPRQNECDRVSGR